MECYGTLRLKAAMAVLKLKDISKSKLEDANV